MIAMDNNSDPQRTWRIRFAEWCGDRTIKQIEHDLEAHKIKMTRTQISDLRNPEFRRSVTVGLAKRLEPVIDVQWTVAFP